MKKIEVKKISLEDAYVHFQQGVTLLDVREYHEISEIAYGLSEVIVMPLSELESRFSELPKDKMLITACKAGGRSLKAAQFLASQGYDQILSMAAGMTQWKDKGLPVVVSEIAYQDATNQNADTSCTCCCDSSSGNTCC